MAAQVGHREVAHVGFIELNERDVAPVRTPAPTVAQTELLFVHPIRRAVDDGAVGSVGRQRGFCSGREVDDEQVAVADERGTLSVGAEFCEHLKALAAVGQRHYVARRYVEDVVVAFGVEAPHALAVCIKQHTVAARAIRVVFDGDLLAGIGSDEVRPVYQDFAGIGFDVVANQIRAVVCPLDVGDDGSAFGPASSLKALLCERVGGVDGVERQALLGVGVWDGGHEQEAEGDEGGAQHKRGRVGETGGRAEAIREAKITD